jgi:hypothetical protein
LTLNCFAYIGSNSKETLTSANHLSTLWRVAGKAGKAEKLLGETLGRCRSTLGNMYALLALLLAMSLCLPFSNSTLSLLFHLFFTSSYSSPLSLSLSLFCSKIIFFPCYLLITFLHFLLLTFLSSFPPLLSFLHHYD